MKSLLITGASGFLGRYACKQFSDTWQTWGTFHEQAITLAGVQTLPLDITDECSVAACWAAARPDAVVHAAALSKAGQCQKAPDRSYQVNVEGTLRLAKRCAAASVPFIFISTDLVFDGTAPPYREGDRPQPINVYGQHKLAAEQGVLQLYPDATICRLPLLLGLATPTANSYLQTLLTAIAAGQPQTLFIDEVRTPVIVTDAVQGLQLVLEQSISGLLHLGGCEALNRYELGLEIASRFSQRADLLIPALQASVSLSTPRPKNVALNSDKAFALGYSPQKIEEALAAIAQLRTTG